LLWRWYRQRAKQKFAERLQKCLAKFHNMPPPPLAIVRLKKRWGSMTPSGRLTLNLDLIRAPVECIDYVIIHELCHRLHPHHGRQFQQLLAAKVGDWRAIKQKLERRLS
jgi:predicted metal-dependent hydrolase